MTFERLRRLLSYDPYLGHLTWLAESDGDYAVHQVPGTRADSKLPHTHIFVVMDHRNFCAAALCVALQYDIWRDVEVMDPELGLILSNLRVVGNASTPPPRANPLRLRIPKFMQSRSHTYPGDCHM